MSPIGCAPTRLLDSITQTARESVGCRDIVVQSRSTESVPPVVQADETHLAVVVRFIAEHAVQSIDRGRVEIYVDYQRGRLSFGVIARDVGTMHLDLLEFTSEIGRRQKLNLERMVERISGRLQVTRPSERTTEYTLELPAMSVISDPEQSTHGPHHRSAARAGREVLIVADIPQNNRYLRYILEKEGCQVAATITASGALKRISERAAKREYDLVVVDMPIGDDPQSRLPSLIRKYGHTGPLVAIASSECEDRIAGECDNIVEKPFHRQTLLEAVSEHLSSTRVETSTPQS